MVNVPPLLSSTPPPIDFGEEDDDSGLQSTLNLEVDVDVDEYGLVTEQHNTTAATSTTAALNDTALTLKTYAAESPPPTPSSPLPPPHVDNCYMTRISPPPFSENDSNDSLKKIKPVEAFNYNIGYDPEAFTNDMNDNDEFGDFQQECIASHHANDAMESLNGIYVAGDHGADVDDDDEEATNNDNVPSLKLDSLSLYSGESVSSATLSPAYTHNEEQEEEEQAPQLQQQELKVQANIVKDDQVTLEDITDDSENVLSPKKHKSLIVDEDADDFFAIHIVSSEPTADVQKTYAGTAKTQDFMTNNSELSQEELFATATKETNDDSIVPCDSEKRTDDIGDDDGDDDNNFATFQTSNSCDIAALPQADVDCNIGDNDNDDFGDFADFSTSFSAAGTMSATPTIVPAALSSALNVASQKDSNAPDVADDEDFDDFQEFVTVNKPASTQQKEVSESPKEAPQVKTVTAAVNAIDDDDDDFGDFSVAAIQPQPQQQQQQQATYTKVPPPPPPAIAHLSITERVKPVLEMMFPSNAHTLANAEVQPTLLDANQALHFSAIEQAKALDYQWNTSDIRHALIRSLAIDSRNILFGDKWNSTMPRYAANLSFDPLKPSKPQAAATSTATTNTHASAEQYSWNNTPSLATQPLEESHVQTLQLEQLDQLMMVAKADKINLDSSNYSHISSTCATTQTTTSTMSNLMDATIQQNDNDNSPFKHKKMPSICQNDAPLPLDIFDIIEMNTNVNNTDNACTAKCTTTTTTNNNNQQHLHDNHLTFIFEQKKNTSYHVDVAASSTSSSSSLLVQTQSVDLMLNCNSIINTQMPYNNNNNNIDTHDNATKNDHAAGCLVVDLLHAYMDCRSDELQQQQQSCHAETSEADKTSEIHAANDWQESANTTIINDDIDVEAAATKTYATANAGDNSSNDSATAPSTFIAATTTATLSSALSADSDGNSFDSLEQQQRGEQKQRQQQHFDLSIDRSNIEHIQTATTTLNNITTTTAAAAIGSNKNINNLDITLLEELAEPAAPATSLSIHHSLHELVTGGCTNATATSVYAVPMKETHIYTPSKSDTAVAKTTTLTGKTPQSTPPPPPIDFDYEIASAGIIIDETVVKKEYRDVEYKPPPFELEAAIVPSAYDVLPIAVATPAINYLDGGAPIEADVDVDDDEFSDFQSVHAAPTPPNNNNVTAARVAAPVVQRISTTPTFGDQMILSPAILLPQAIPLAKPATIEWGNCAVSNINPDELARIEELFPQPKIAASKTMLKEASSGTTATGGSVHVTPTHQQTPSISAAVALNQNDNDDEWSDFVSVPIHNHNNNNNVSSIKQATTTPAARALPKLQAPLAATSKVTVPPANAKAHNADDEWSDFVSVPAANATATATSPTPQFNSGAWHSANLYNNPLSLYQQQQTHVHSNVVPSTAAYATKYKQHTYSNNNISSSSSNNNNNYISSNQTQQAQPQQQQQLPQQIHFMHDFSTMVEPMARNNPAAMAYLQQHHHQTSQFQIGNAKIAPRISLIPDLSFVSPALPNNAGAFMSSLPKPSFSAKK